MKTAVFYDYIVIVFYMLLMIAMSIAFKRLNKNTNDYFRGGCRTMWWMVGASSFMTAFSAWTFTGAASQAYSSGMCVSVIFFANTLGFFINAAFLAPWYRQIRATTLPEVLRKRYNRTTQQIYAWTGVLYSFLMAGIHLWGIAIFASAVFGFPLLPSIIIIGVVVVIISTLGGTWSVMATEFVQSLILMPMTLLIALLCMVKIGGPSGFITALDSMGLSSYLSFFQHGEGAKFTVAYTIALVLKQILVYNGFNDAPKYFSVKDGRDARKAALMAGILMFAGALIWFIPPIFARIQFSGIVDAIPMKTPSEAAFAVVSMQMLPTGLLGLMVVAMLATTMSSMDSSLNRNSAVITRDIIKGLLFRNATEKQLFVAAHVFTLIAGAIVILLAVYFMSIEGKGIFDLMIQVGALLAVPKLIPLLWGIFVKRTPSWSALFALGCGLTMSVLSLIYKWNFQTTLFTNFAVGSIAYFATIPFYKFAPESYKNSVETFFTLMKTPIDYAKEVGGRVDVEQFRMIGYSSLVLGIFVLSLIAIPDNSAWWPFLFVSGFMVTVGSFFIYKSIIEAKLRDAAVKATIAVNTEKVEEKVHA